MTPALCTMADTAWLSTEFLANDRTDDREARSREQHSTQASGFSLTISAAASWPAVTFLRGAAKLRPLSKRSQYFDFIFQWRLIGSDMRKAELAALSPALPACNSPRTTSQAHTRVQKSVLETLTYLFC